MRIAFDQQIFCLQQYGGVSRYFCSLAEHLSQLAGVSVRIVAPLHINAYLSVLPRDLARGWKRPRTMPRVEKVMRAISASLAGPAIRGFRPEIVHQTYFSDSAFMPQGPRRVVTVYDMIHERFASSFAKTDPTTKWKRAAVSRADHVICISQHTRRDLIELFGVPEEKVSVVYLGVDELAPSGAQTEDVASVTSSSPYLLFVGSRGRYKNFKGLLLAYASSAFLKDNFSLLSFGGGQFGGELASLIQQLGLSGKQVKQLEGDDDALGHLYQNAAALIYPSLYEGFGIPPLEAMSLGCPVICSDTSSIPEVVGDAGEYFDPASVESIRFAIEGVLQSPARRNELVQLGARRYRQFRWESCARETHAIYNALI